MYNKTIWNPGDIITQEKWDNINNNLSILEAYQLPVTIVAKHIIIHKSYSEITKLLKQGTICWYYNNLNGTINYIIHFNNFYKTLNDGNNNFVTNGNEMTNQVKGEK